MLNSDIRGLRGFSRVKNGAKPWAMREKIRDTFNDIIADGCKARAIAHCDSLRLFAVRWMRNCPEAYFFDRAAFFF